MSRRKSWNINRFLLIIWIGFALYMAAIIAGLIYRWSTIEANLPAFVDTLLQNSLSNSIFFILVGLAGVIAQFYKEQGDVLQQRVRNIFLNKDVSLPVINYFEEVARSSAVYATAAEHKITILEFNPKICAYRADFENSYHLKNAFGDTPYDENVSMRIAPDFTRNTNGPLAKIEQLSLQHDHHTKKYIENPQEISADGFKTSIRITLPPYGEASLYMRWWSYIDAIGNWDSGFSTSRFSERFKIIIVNRSTYCAVLSRHTDNRKIEIKPGENFVVCDESSVPPKTRVEFYWHPPLGVKPNTQLKTGKSGTDLLEFDKRLGEKDTSL